MAALVVGGFHPNWIFVVTASTTREQVPRHVRFVRVDGSVRVLPANIFRSCKSLEEVIFEEGVRTIGESAFDDCESLTNVKFPFTLREIPFHAFFHCTRLRSIDLPLGLEVIREGAFVWTNLRHLQIPATVKLFGRGAIEWCRQLESIILPPRLEVIENDLFCGCGKVEEFDIPRTIKSIGEYAFGGCRALKKMELLHCTQCLTIGSHAFVHALELLWITLPPNLEGSIEQGTFSSCSKLTHVRVPPNITSIGCRGQCNPFEGCASLLSLELPEGLEKIELLAFREVENWVDVFRWQALVNLYLPPSEQVVSNEVLDESIPEDFQLAKVAQNWGDLLTELQHRFDDRPLHRICYFHSYHPINDTLQRIRDILIENPFDLIQTDAFGMTPLHILALAQTPRLELFQMLFTSVDLIMSAKDRFGSIVLDYLGKNRSEGGLQVTRWLMQKIVEQRVAHLGLDRWKQELLVLMEGVAKADCPLVMNSELQSLLDRLSKLELFEALSLVELFLWRIRLSGNTSGRESTDRESCRVHCGIFIVVENVLPFLGKE